MMDEVEKQKKGREVHTFTSYLSMRHCCAARRVHICMCVCHAVRTSSWRNRGEGLTDYMSWCRSEGFWLTLVLSPTSHYPHSLSPPLGSIQGHCKTVKVWTVHDTES